MNKNKLPISLALYSVVIFAVMVCFEIIENDFLSPKNIWIAHSVSIGFVTFLSMALYVVAGKFFSQYRERMLRENEEAVGALAVSKKENLSLKSELEQLQRELNTVQGEFSRQISRYQELLHMLPEYIIHTDLKGKILQVNQEVLNGTGFSYEEIFGRDIKIIIREDDREYFWDGFQKTLSGVPVKELVVRDIRGKQFLFNFILLKKPHEEMAGVLCVAMELSKTSKIIEELNQSRLELDQKVKEMELLHQVSFEREKRILELKQQIADLKSELTKSSRG